ALEERVIRVLELAGRKARHVRTFRLVERVEQVGRQSGVRGEDVVPDDDGVVDRVEAAVAQRREAGVARVGDERLDVRRIDLDADRGRNLAGNQQVLHLLVFFDGDDVGGRPVFGDVLVSGQYPGDPIEIHAVLMLKYAARPETRGHGIPPVHTHPPALEIPGTPDAGLRVVQDGPVM